MARRLIDLVDDPRRKLPMPVDVPSVRGAKLGVIVPSDALWSEAQTAALAWCKAKGMSGRIGSDDEDFAARLERGYAAASELICRCLVEIDTRERVAANSDEVREALTRDEIDHLYSQILDLMAEVAPKTHDLTADEIKALVADLGKGQRPADWTSRSQNFGRSTLRALLDSTVALLVKCGGATCSPTTTD